MFGRKEEKKSLSDILGIFTTAKDELNTFKADANNTITSINAQQAKLETEKEAVSADLESAAIALKQIEAIVPNTNK